MEYIFILGRSGELCLAELKAVLKRKKISYKPSFESDEILHIKTDKELSVDHLISILGGTIKIAEVVDKTKLDVDKDNLIETIALIISQEKKDFGISFYGHSYNHQDLSPLPPKLKKLIKEKSGLNLNYVLPQTGLSLSSVVVVKRKLNEINLIEENNEVIIAKTLVVQDFCNWNLRDYGRPKVLPEKGMLPPKVARMMINLGLSDFPASPTRFAVRLGSTESRRESRRAGGRNPTSEIRLFDPFCGVGTILAEALMLECNVIGSDNDQRSVKASQGNLEWLVRTFNLPTGEAGIKHLIRPTSPASELAGGRAFNIFQSDAAHISEKVERESIDLIVTEPYLGPLTETEYQVSSIKHQVFKTKTGKKITLEYLKNIIIGLEKLYIGCLKDWWKILKPSGRIVITIPSFNIKQDQRNFSVDIGANRRFFVKKPLDICENLGYTLTAGSYQYFRPQAVVIRNIYIFKKIQS